MPSPYLSRKKQMNVVDVLDGRTPAMRAADAGNVKEFSRLVNTGIDIDAVTEDHESILSIVLGKLRDYHIRKLANTSSYENVSSMLDYKRILNIMIYHQCNFNVTVDRDGNTAFMALMLLPEMALTLPRVSKTVDLSIPNQFGDNASSLCIKQNLSNLYPVLKYHPSFNFAYRDPETGNTLPLLAAISQPTILKDLLDMDPRVYDLNDTNLKMETALILATKSGCLASVQLLLDHPEVEINRQDHLGNTALHYAVMLQDLDLITTLLSRGSSSSSSPSSPSPSNNPDPTLQNRAGQSPLDLAQQSGNVELQEILEHPETLTSSSNRNKGKSRNRNKKRNGEENLRVNESPDTFNYFIPHLTVNYGSMDIPTILSQRTREYLVTTTEKDDEATTCCGSCCRGCCFCCGNGSSSSRGPCCQCKRGDCDFTLQNCINSLVTCFCYCCCFGCFGLHDVLNK